MNIKNLELPKKVKQGLNAFNQKSFYQAHEYFEDAWRETPDPSREFYRALLHISGGFFRLSQGKPEAASKFFQHALKWLNLFEPDHLSFDLNRLKDKLRTIICEIDNRKRPEIILAHYGSIISDITEET